MGSILVWDLPTRIFHWLFALCVVVALGIGLIVDDDEALFSVHMLCGFSALCLVVLRLGWGLVGSRYAKLRTFIFSPRELFAYLRETLFGRGVHVVGRNPASAYATLGMLFLTLVMVVSGVLSLSTEACREVHETAAYLMLALIMAHVAGLAWNALRHRGAVWQGMVTGYESGEPEAALSTAHPLAGVIFCALSLLAIGSLWRGYDSGSRTLHIPLMGKTLVLEPEEEKGEHEGGHEAHKHGKPVAVAKGQDGDDDDD